MKSLILASVFMSLCAFAHVNTVEVVIDGQVYSCIGSGGIGNTCTEATRAADSKFKACRNSGFSSTECYRMSFPKKIENCSEWSELCNTSCRNSGFSSTECFKGCF